ncbi:MAG TPA: class I SAM-dependent methyltransferase [Methanoregulaceae archaeon]|nr:class I SAM-dependent methyltransferase [Methanoregulaceae archaeon]
MISGKPNEKDYFGSGRREMLPFVPLSVKRLLDIGCGAGTFGANIKARQNCEVWGIEMDAKQGQEASRILDKVIIGDAVGKLDEIPPSFFDCIVCNDLLEHLVDPFSFLKRLRRPMVSEGILVASVPNVRYYRVLKDLIIHRDWKYKEPGVLDIDHLRFFTRKSMIRMFTDGGWKIKTVTGINPTSSRTFRIMNLLLFGRLGDVCFRQFAIQAE